MDNNYIDSINIITIYDRKKWRKDELINVTIINGNIKLKKVGLVFETIYNENISVGAFILDWGNRSFFSTCRIKSIYNISDLKQFEIDTCFVKDCSNRL